MMAYTVSIINLGHKKMKSEEVTLSPALISSPSSALYEYPWYLPTGQVNDKEWDQNWALLKMGRILLAHCWNTV